MMRGLIDTLERHHGVRILNEAVVDAVRLSNRYISGPAIARQIGEPARHGLCPRGDEPRRHAAGDRRPAAAASSNWACRSTSSNAKTSPAATTTKKWPS